LQVRQMLNALLPNSSPNEMAIRHSKLALLA
jgi:hypothetical protein